MTPKLEPISLDSILRGKSDDASSARQPNIIAPQPTSVEVKVTQPNPIQTKEDKKIVPPPIMKWAEDSDGAGTKIQSLKMSEDTVLVLDKSAVKPPIIQTSESGTSEPAKNQIIQTSSEVFQQTEEPTIVPPRRKKPPVFLYIGIATILVLIYYLYEFIKTIASN
jgi:hypothetical protein